MAKVKRGFISNQIFVGLPWKTVRQKYEAIIQKLIKTYPLYFTIVGRDDGLNAESLFAVIKERISTSSYAVFDATGGNANVSLEYGYAEGIDVPRAIFVSAHKAAQKQNATSPIISDLLGMRRVPYKTDKTLMAALHKLCKEHDYTTRFERALSEALKGKPRGEKKRNRTLALKIVHALDNKVKIRRSELVQRIQAQGYIEPEIDFLLKKLSGLGILKCKVGRYSDVYIA
ncbi:MAG: hypothetical protein ABSF70_14270 [Terracidiphilus sp.]